MSRLLTAALFFSLAGTAIPAQTAVGGDVTNFRDTSMLHPPPGVKVAIIEWEDLECPACARAFPIVHQAIAHYHVPLVRYDFQIPGHIWSHQASIYARYMQDKISPDMATDYRRQVFASQFRIASLDDLNQFTQQFMQSHGKALPFVVDPTKQFEREVTADDELGKKLGLMETPTIVVVTPRGWIQVRDVMDLYQAIDEAEAKMAAPAVRHTSGN
jgi:protein-disulfide isomerase